MVPKPLALKPELHLASLPMGKFGLAVALVVSVTKFVALIFIVVFLGCAIITATNNRATGGSGVRVVVQVE